MSTEAQINANRRNSEKCSGPTSSAGKARSSQNALKTGLDAKSEVIRGESRPEYEALIAEYYVEYNPTVPQDRALVDMMISSEWLCRRYRTIDASVWERGFLDTESQAPGRVYLRSNEAFDRVGRRINWAQRNFQQALKQLLEIRAKRAAEPVPEAPMPVETAPLTPKLVSICQPAPEAAPEPLSQPTIDVIDAIKEDEPPIAA